MNETKYAIIQIVIMAVLTAAIRFAPFILFPENRKKPKFITYLGKVLPFAIIGMLVIYCFKNLSFAAYPYAIPEILAGIIVVLLHLWKRNTLLSVFGGTAIYMIMINFIFK